MRVGLDIGSTTIKCVVLDEHDSILYSTYERHYSHILEKAQELLAESSGRTLADISASCGYPNKSYFCQVFKKYTGITPGEYEQQRHAEHHE